MVLPQSFPFVLKERISSLLIRLRFFSFSCLNCGATRECRSYIKLLSYIVPEKSAKAKRQNHWSIYLKLPLEAKLEQTVAVGISS